MGERHSRYQLGILNNLLILTDAFDNGHWYLLPNSNTLKPGTKNETDQAFWIARFFTSSV